MSDDVRNEDHMLSFPVRSWGITVTDGRGSVQPSAARLVLANGSVHATLYFTAGNVGGAAPTEGATRMGGTRVECSMAMPMLAPILSALQSGQTLTLDVMGPSDGEGQLTLHWSGVIPASAAV